MPRCYEQVFSKTQHKALQGFAAGPREREASDLTLLLLERKGYLRRVGAIRAARRASHPVIEWTITQAGRERLQEGPADH